ncbi:hypothetical protein LCGC14_1196820 [marine sediment metagenome]|uniref:Uncharacterized protein n=1 Tax=marine sediment metagenome TaxID=412755 RepID=A0A0F9LMI8_9ZZZZ
MKAISGEPIANKYALDTRDDKYSLDFLYSENLADIEAGIQETIKGLDMSILAVGLAFVKIDREALYVQAGYKHYLAYLDQAEDRLDMSRQTMSDYKRIGETYLDYKSKLQKAGFIEEGNLHKLRFLERALGRHRSAEVFKRICSDSLRAFRAYALGKPSEQSDDKPLREYNPDIQITTKRIMVDGKNILRIDPDLDEKTKLELTDYLKQIYTIRSTGNQPYIFNLYDELEAKAIERFLKKRRKVKN